MKTLRLFCYLLIMLCALGLGGAHAGDGAPAVQSAPKTRMAQATAGAMASQTSPGYVLGTGDQIRLVVYGEDDLSGTYEIGSTGVVALPLIGNITAANITISQFEEAVRAKLMAGYLQNPHVNAQVVNYRPFFILGEVAKPGSYPYVNGLTVLNAVALAGGYTYRAQSDGALVVRANDPSKTERRIREEDAVLPGDIVRIPERFF